MKKLLIFTAGSAAHETLKLIKEINKKKKVWNFIGFVDPGFKSKNYKNFKKDPKLKNCYAICPILDENIRKKIYLQNIIGKYKIPNLIHPKVDIPNDIKLGVGNIIINNLHLSFKINIGNYNLFSFNNDLGHNFICGDYNSLMPNVVIGGNVKIGNLNSFSVNSIVLPMVKIGNNNKIGPLSLISSEIKSNNKVTNYPRQIITKK